MFFYLTSHSVLLCKLNSYDIPQYIINWIAKFFIDRTQCISIFNETGIRIVINCSINQRYRTGPCLFLTIFADLVSKYVTTIDCKFADNHTILIPGIYSSCTCDDIDNLKEWSSINKLLINFEKTKEIVLCRSGRVGRLVNLPSSVYDIEQVKEVKLLDMHLSNHLSFRVHVNNVISVVNQRFYLMKVLRAQGLSDFGLSVVLNALILS
jgi:Reverse transcriptase (RNA-dependent DNA polymerase)